MTPDLRVNVTKVARLVCEKRGRYTIKTQRAVMSGFYWLTLKIKRYLSYFLSFATLSTGAFESVSLSLEYLWDTLTWFKYFIAYYRLLLELICEQTQASLSFQTIWNFQHLPEKVSGVCFLPSQSHFYVFQTRTLNHTTAWKNNDVIRLRTINWGSIWMPTGRVAFVSVQFHFPLQGGIISPSLSSKANQWQYWC